MKILERVKKWWNGLELVTQSLLRFLAGAAVIIAGAACVARIAIKIIVGI